MKTGALKFYECIPHYNLGLRIDINHYMTANVVKGNCSLSI